MTPFNITIEINEATQCHQVVSQLLRVFPKLSLTITAHETIATPARSPRACTPLNRCGSCYYCADLLRAVNCLRSSAEARRLGANSDASTTRDEAALVAARCATPADGKTHPSYPWKTDDFNDAVADARIEADAAAAERDEVHRRNGDENTDGGPL